MLNDLYKDDAAEIAAKLGLCEETTRNVYAQMRRRRINSVDSTSAGRLFDAVSAILGIRLSSTFEGEASTSLQFAAEAYEERLDCGTLDFIKEKYKEEWEKLTDPEEAEERFLLPTHRLVRMLTDKKIAGEDSGELAYLFHALLAEQIVHGCKRASKCTKITTCALSGGVFQNQLLLKICDHRLTEEGFLVLKHSLIPPNDGGIAVGQAVFAMHTLCRRREKEK